jgi:uridine phosphorylase
LIIHINLIIVKFLGRIDPNFDDGNENVINDIITTYPTAISMEMETFTLLHLAKSSREIIKASAAAIVVANRLSAKVIDGNTLDKLEELGGKAILNAVCKISL